MEEAATSTGIIGLGRRRSYLRRKKNKRKNESVGIYARFFAGLTIASSFLYHICMVDNSLYIFCQSVLTHVLWDFLFLW